MKLAEWIIANVSRRSPDFVIGRNGHEYLLRWYVIPRNRMFNIYLHKFLRDDDDRALHDHPWLWCSILLRGRYIEHTISNGGVNHRVEYHAGSIRMRRPTFAHRLELIDRQECWTLFLTGPKIRTWGFHCPHRWIPWQQFVDRDDSGKVGAGCEQ